MSKKPAAPLWIFFAKRACVTPAGVSDEFSQNSDVNEVSEIVVNSTIPQTDSEEDPDTTSLPQSHSGDESASAGASFYSPSSHQYNTRWTSGLIRLHGG